MKTFEITVTVRFVTDKTLKEKTESILGILTSGLHGEVIMINAYNYGDAPMGLQPASSIEMEGKNNEN